MAMDLRVQGRFGLLLLDLPPWSQLLNSIFYWTYAVLNNSCGLLGLSDAKILHHNWFTNFIYARSGLIGISSFISHASGEVWMQKI